MHPPVPSDPTPPTRVVDDAATLPAPASPPAQPVVPGYLVGRPLGRGGMGEVWLAEHATLHRTVALKVLRSDFTRDQAFVERFLREARAAARLNHPGVITVHDAGRAGDSLYLAMEYMPGGDLRARIADGRGLPPAEAARLIGEVATALQAIHDAGLVHRDLKPENILLDHEGRPRIADLGLARSEQGDDRMTSTGQAMGTPAYMSPEQAKGAADVDARSDVYALGATLFALLTGRPPFTGATPWVVVAQVMNEPPPDVRHFATEVPPALAAVVQRALAKDRARRQPSAQVFADEVRAALAAPLRSPALRPHRSGRWWIAAAVVALVGGWVLLARLARGDGPATAGAAAPPPAPSTAAAAPRASEPPDAAPGKPVATAPDGDKPRGERNPFLAIRDGFREVRSAVRGTLTETVPATLERTTRTVRAVLRQQGLTLVRDRSDAAAAVLETRFSDGEDLTVTLRPGSGGTEVAVQVGALGDQTRARQVLDWIKAGL